MRFRESMKQAVVAMSGGVDSSVAAYLVREAGFRVTGATMRLYDREEMGISSETACCSIDSWKDAEKVAAGLGIDYIIYDMRTEFRREVVDRFIAAYERAETPNPCVDCNRYLKFESLYRLSVRDLEAEGKTVNKPSLHPASPADDRVMIATGHYARIEFNEGTGRWMLRKAVDLSKDQTYFLYNMTQEQLSRTMFPLGSMSKPEVRSLAAELQLESAHKAESQDICFIPAGGYASFIESFTGRTYPPGDFVDESGRTLGTHKGLINYTVGQRKGLGLALRKPAYVLKLDIEHNQVVLGDNESLFTRELTADSFNWLSVAPPEDELRVYARIRYRHREAPATLRPQPDGSVLIVFDEPQRAVTGGQSVVVYGGTDNEYVLGGGVIRRG